MRNASPLLLALMFLGLLAGFWSGVRNSRHLVEQAARDLGCPADQIEVSLRGPRSGYRDVEACGRHCVYYVSLGGRVSRERCD